MKKRIVFFLCRIGLYKIAEKISPSLVSVWRGKQVCAGLIKGLNLLSYQVSLLEASFKNLNCEFEIKPKEEKNGMREILFRGKRKAFKKSCGEWIKGYISVLFPVDMPKRYGKEKIVIIPTGAECNWFNKFLYDVIEVDPETVGQYTGLTDKNGTKIFEGDIVQSIELELKGIIVFDEHCRFMIKDFPTGSTYLLSYNNDEIKVIGNIHDNPELLE